MEKLYNDFDDLNMRCPEHIRDALIVTQYNFEKAVQYADEFPENPMKAAKAYYLPEIYAKIANYMNFGTLYNKEALLGEYVRREQNKPVRKFTDDYYVTKFLPHQYNAQEEAIPLSSALHIMHTKFPMLRTASIDYSVNDKKFLLREKGIWDVNLEKTVEFETPECLSGKDAFPPYIRDLVEEKLSCIKGDIAADYFVSWEYSHLDMGGSYDYSISEGAYMVIRSTDEKAVEYAAELAESISFDEIATKWKEYGENEINEEYSAIMRDIKDIISNPDAICTDFGNVGNPSFSDRQSLTYVAPGEDYDMSDPEQENPLHPVFTLSRERDSQTVHELYIRSSISTEADGPSDNSLVLGYHDEDVYYEIFEFETEEDMMRMRDEIVETMPDRIAEIAGEIEHERDKELAEFAVLTENPEKWFAGKQKEGSDYSRYDEYDEEYDEDYDYGDEENDYEDEEYENDEYDMEEDEFEW